MLRCVRVCWSCQQVTEAVVRQEIGDRTARLAAYQDRWERLKQVIDARAKHYSNRPELGASTGLLIPERTAKGTERFLLDTGLLKSMADLEKQAAIEKGQWVGRVDEKWDGDPEKLSAGQLDKLIEWLTRRVYGDDPEVLKEAQAKAIALVDQEELLR